MADLSVPKLGILMLDTAFPRILGDVGNAETWPFAVRYGVVKGATPQAIVCEDIEPFVQAFIEEGQRLVALGCTGIATTCGFLSLIRPRLVEALGVPVAASALEQAGQIAGAGLDVYEQEPTVPEALMAMENVTLLPHLGTNALEVRTQMGLMAVNNINAHFDGIPLPNPV